MVSLLPAVQSSAAAPSLKASKPSLLRRGTIRKADDAGLDMDSLSAPGSPSKKARVTFKEEVEEKVMEDFKPKARSLESVRADVQRSISGHLRGDSEAYDALRLLFKPNKEGEEDVSDEIIDLKTYIIALTGSASTLNTKCNGLVRVLLDFEWLGRDEGFFKAYVYFLGSLASSQGTYVQTILEMLVDRFTRVKFSSGRLPGCPDVNRAQLAKRVHVAMKYLLRLIPSASSVLSDVLPRKYPDIEDSQKMHITYIENLVQLIEYAPELKSDVFALITTEVVKIDVNMQTNLDDLDDEVAAAIVQAININSKPSADGAGSGSESDSDSATSGDELTLDAKRVKLVQTNIEKLDTILDLLFTIYNPYFADPNSAEAASMFETLLAHFATIILRNYRSRHTQFLLFHFAQTAEHLVDQFAGTCVQLAFEASQPAVFRQSSAAYLASFVARGAHIQPHVVRTVFELIGSNLDQIRIDNEVTCRGPDLGRYGTFYAMTQALLYIFCFKWRDLITSSEISEEEDPMGFVAQDLSWTHGIKETLTRTIYSKLNPLKVCSPMIVAEFAKIANHLRFLYVYPLLETNKRIRLSHHSSSHSNGALRETNHGGSNDSWHQLDTYFPFDPYQLPVSKRWLEGDYVEWRGVPGLVQAEEDDDESGSEEEDEDVDIDEEEDDTEEDDDE